MCSPLGRATLNSLMKVATLRLPITVHSHSFTPITDSGTFTSMSPFILAWHPSRQLSFISLREKCGFSESRISPPPFRICSLHCPQLAFPPQAEGRCIPCSLRVFITLSPCSTSSTLSPFTVSFTFPLGLRYFFATSSTVTSMSITARNTPMLANI